jgi:AcrR family transcriptional regulator
VEIADAEGFEAVAMRRVARELDAGTMTLYHYVRNKDELIELMGDAIMGELLIPEGEVPDGWREAFAEIARRTRAIFSRHPWVLEHISEGDDRASPNALRHVEQSLAVASRTGLDREGQFELVALIDDYVFGFVIRTHEGPLFGEDDGSTTRRLDARLAYFEDQLATGEFPHLQALMGDDVREALTGGAQRAADERRFERGLQILLDGMALYVERRRGSEPAA